MSLIVIEVGPNELIGPRVVAGPPMAIVTVGSPDGGGDVSELGAGTRLSVCRIPPRQAILTRSPTSNRAARFRTSALRIEQLTLRTSIRFGLRLVILPLNETTTSGVAPNDTPGVTSDPAAAKTTTLDRSCVTPVAC